MQAVRTAKENDKSVVQLFSIVIQASESNNPYRVIDVCTWK